MSEASETQLDLHTTIDKLRLFKSDLEAYYWDRTGEGELPERQRYQIALWMKWVSERAVSLEDVVMRMGCPFVVVIGHPEFYPRFGFEPAGALGLTCEWEVPAEAFMVNVLQAELGGRLRGRAQYRPEFSTLE